MPVCVKVRGFVCNNTFNVCNNAFNVCNNALNVCNCFFVTVPCDAIRKNAKPFSLSGSKSGFALAGIVGFGLTGP